MLEHSLGLGHKPNVIPPAEPTTDGPVRAVEIGWHPVAGLAGKWFAEKTRLGTWITEKVHKYPDPSQHWAVLVGGFAHELWMDEHLDVIYINEAVNHEEWHTFAVGETRLNDEALRRTAEAVMDRMRAARPAYNLISNNCQNFALLLLDAIQTGEAAAHAGFGTALAVVKAATGPGRISDLFADKPAAGGHVEVVPVVAVGGDGEEQQQQQQAVVVPASAPVEEKVNPIVALAKRLMDEHTTKLDNHRHEH